MKVGVVGASGYGGIELLRLLATHPVLDVATVAAQRAAGSTVGGVAPSLAGSALAGLPVTGATPDALAGCEVVFLATPAGVSMELAPPLGAAGALVIDLSGAFRLPPDTFAEWYDSAHAAPTLTPAVYGLPELFADDLAGSGPGDIVAGPGCYATAALLALWPLTGLVDPATVSVVGMSGVSGAGRGLRDDLHAAHVMGSVSPYGAPHHRHTPEIEHAWSAAAAASGRTVAPRITFVPHLVPTSRGLIATVTAALAPGVAPGAVAEAVRDTYAAAVFVTVRDRWPSTGDVIGGNGAHVHVAVDGRTGRVVSACAIDNLVKGAAGQAVQAANVSLGLPEASGLDAIGVYP